jgi:hypothetical protein
MSMPVIGVAVTCVVSGSGGLRNVVLITSPAIRHIPGHEPNDIEGEQEAFAVVG